MAEESTLLWSAASGGFYLPGLSTTIPADAVTITAETHAALLDAQAAGSIIVAGADGAPIATAAPAPSDDDVRAALRARRNALLAACDYTQMADAPLSADARTAWATYRQALRDLPATTNDLAAIAWPAAPAAAESN